MGILKKLFGILKPEPEQDTTRLADMPSAEKEPSVDKKTATAKKPAADKKPTAAKKPAAEKKPAATKKPATNKPSAKKPAAAEKMQIHVTSEEDTPQGTQHSHSEAEETISVPEPISEQETSSAGNGVFSARLEAMIAAALQDGILTDKERELLKKRAEKEGEDWDEVEMIIEARLAETESVTPAAPTPQKKNKTIVSDAAKTEKEESVSTEEMLSRIKQVMTNNDIMGDTKISSRIHASDYLRELVNDYPELKISIPIYLNCVKFFDTEDEDVAQLKVDKLLKISEIKRAVAEKKNPKQLIIPEEVKKIKWWDYDCSKYEEIIFPSSLEIIDANNYSNNENLKKIDFSKCDKLEEIRQKAFKNSLKLESVIFPSSLKLIGLEAFCGCENLKEIDLSKCDKLEEIGDSAFVNCHKLESVIFPSSLKEIEANAFASCKNLKKVDLSLCDLLEEISYGAFYKCASLSEIDFSSCVSLKFFAGSALSDCPIRILDFSKCKSLDLRWSPETKNLEKVIMPSGQKSFNEVFLLEQSGITVDVSYCKEVKQIKSKCFEEMDMKEIVILDTVETIGENAFDECKELKTIVMPASLKEIHAPLGGRMEQLKKVDFSKVTQLRVIPKTVINSGCHKLKELIIPQGVVEIEDDAFSNLWYLKKLFLPPSLTTMGDLDLDKITIYCYSPHLEELEPLVYGWDDENDDNYEDMDEEDMRELGIEPGKKNQIKTTLYVLPQYVDAYTAQRNAEGIPYTVLPILPIPDELLYYYDN